MFLKYIKSVQIDHQSASVYTMYKKINKPLFKQLKMEIYDTPRVQKKLVY